MKNLHTTKDVVEVIGRAELERLGRATPQMISNWISKNRFSPHDVDWMTKHLKSLGYSAHAELWSQTNPARGLFFGRWGRRSRARRAMERP